MPIKPFQSDGCSGGLSVAWHWLFKVSPPFEYCCYEHDEAYYVGGGLNALALKNFTMRLKADVKLLLCMWKQGWQGKLLCVPVFMAVRLGGGSYFKRPYSWGFGWRI